MSSKTKLIFKNTIFLYFRTFFLIFIGLYTSRVVLEILGVEDLGIYNVVASVVLMLEFVSSSLTNASQRYFNIGLGKNDFDLTNNYFSQSVGVHFFISILLILLLETLGLWLLEYKLEIPDDKRWASYWVYQMAILSVVIKINQVSFQSLILARENMSLYAYLSLFEGVSKLVIVFLIGVFDFDKLVFYAFLLLCVEVMVFICHVIYCRSKYSESKFRLFFDKSLFHEMLGFVGLNIFGSISWSLGVQGINVLLNIFFGPAINGARALASTLGRYINQFINNIFMAIKPQLIKCYAAERTDEMLIIAEKSSVYIFYLVLIFVLPLLFDTEFVLDLWLKQVPAYTVGYAKIILIQSFLWMLAVPYSFITTATGRIKNVQLYGRLFTLSALPVSYILLQFQLNPYIPLITVCLMDVFYLGFTVFDVSRQLKFGVCRYFTNVLFPIAIVGIPVVFIMFMFYGYIYFEISSYPALNFFGLGVFSFLITSLFIFLFGLKKGEILVIKGFLKSKVG